MEPQVLEQKIKLKKGLLLIDVRSHWEFAAGHIEGAHNVPYWKIFQAKRLIRGMAQGELVLCCEHGPRAWLSGALLKTVGIRGIQYLDGHMMRWKSEGRPVLKS